MRSLHLRPATIEEIRPLRAAVLRPGMPFEAAVWRGDDDPGALHVAACSPDGPGRPGVVGVVSLLPAAYPGPGGGEPGNGNGDGARDDIRDGAGPPVGAPGYQLRGMAVATAAQGRGIGAALLRGALYLLAERGAPLVWCNARLVVAGFYERGGFVRDGGEHALAPLGIVHVRMHRPVPARQQAQQAQQSARQGGTSP
ncbi:MAG: GNAT family N-acetyltransferase [Frankiaceae bacterium]